MLSDSNIMSVREMIDIAFGEPDVNVVNFKLMQTILYLLARQQRLLERRVAIELGVNLVPRTSSLSITEVKIKANVLKKKKKTSGDKSGTAPIKPKGEKDKTSSRSTTNETSTLKSKGEKDKTTSRSTTDESSTLKSKGGKDRPFSIATTDKTSTPKSKGEQDKTSSRSTTDDTSTLKSKVEKDKPSSRATTEETLALKSKGGKDKTSKSITDETSTSKSLSEPTTTDKASFKSSTDKTTTSKSTSEKTSSADKTTSKSFSDKTSPKSATDKTASKLTSEKYTTEKTTSSELSSSQKSKNSSDKTKVEDRSGKTKETDYHLLELLEQQREQELRVVNQRADSREVAEKTPTPMASLDSMEVQYEKLLVVERVPVEEAEKKMGRLRDGKTPKLDLVTQKEFDELAQVIKEMQKNMGIVGDPDFQKNLQGLRRASSMTDAMAALQLSGRIEFLENALKLMESAISGIAAKKGVKITQNEEVNVQTYVVQTQKGGQTPETKVIYDAPYGPSDTSGKSGGEAEDTAQFSEPLLTGTVGDPIMEMLEGLPKVNNINGADLDNAMQELYDELIATVGSLTNKAINTADGALKTATRLEAKLDSAIAVDTRMENLETVVSEYTGKINVIDGHLSSQMTNYQEQLTQMQQDLEGGLEAMAEALANPPGEIPGAAELTANFANLQIQFDISSMRQKELQENQGVLSLDIEALWKEIEVLREVKADRDEVTDALRDKAGLGQLNGLISQQQFDAVRGDFEKRIAASYDKFNNQEIIWQKIIDDLLRELNDKSDWTQLAALRDDVNNNLERLRNKIRAVEEIVGEPHAATVSRRLFRDAACLSCATPALMNMEETTLPALPAFSNLLSRPPTIGAEETRKPKEDGDHGLCYPGKQIPHARDPRAHICRRYCGGSHTAIRGTLSRAPTEIGVSAMRRETPGVGSDGKVYVMDGHEKEKKPCGPCNILKTFFTPPASEIGKGSKFDLDSDTDQFFELPMMTTVGPDAVSEVSVTPPPPLDDD